MIYDVIILGGGPAGYLAAQRLGQQGKKTLLVESGEIGGTCLNCGCIPTKSLLNGAKQYLYARDAATYGVNTGEVTFDWGRMQSWKTDVVTKLQDGINGLLKRFKVDQLSGYGELLSSNRVRVKPTSGAAAVEHEGRAILIATGSTPAMPPIPGARDNPLVIDSTALLEVETVPERLCVIGGGVIGVEFASLFASLGSQVTVVEMLKEIVPFMDKEQSTLLRRAMKQVAFKLGCQVQRIEGANVFFNNPKGSEESVEADLVLMAVGRRPALQGWGAEKAGLDAPAGGIVVDERMRTNIPGIWAAGDVTGRSLLAHSAYRMAEVAVADIVATLEGGAPSAALMRYDAIPWAVYGIPEAAGVGITEQEAAEKGIAIKKASMPLRASGRFVAENGIAALGSVKLIVSEADDRILGLHAVGAYASEFIWGGAALIEQEMRAQDLRELILPHPTVCELIRDVAWMLP